MKKIISCLLAVLLVIGLTACSVSKDYTGKYLLTKITEEGKTYKEGDDTWNLLFKDVKMKDYFYIQLKDNDKLTLMAFGEKVTGKYKIDGEKITITNVDSSEDMSGTIKDNKIIISVDKSSMTFEK